MINNTKIEICIGNVLDAIIASKYPIDRIELNSALELGGLSPSLETLIYLKEKIETKICCMVRPRGGDFYYNNIEYELMLKQAKNFLENRADGIVFGFLNLDKTIDIDRTKKMVDLIHSYQKEAIFHKAFDEVEDSDKAIQSLIELKVDRILTSGKQSSENILIGCELINDLQNKYGHLIELLPGGGVRIDNILDVVYKANTKQVHMTSKQSNPNGYLCLDEKQLQILLKELETNEYLNN